MKPKSAEYDIGKDIYGRNIRVEYRVTLPSDPFNGGGVKDRKGYAIMVEDTLLIAGLTAENLKALAEVVKSRGA